MKDGHLHSPNDPLALAREVAAGDSAFFEKLLQAFLEDGTARVEAMEEALARGDLMEASRLAHSLKGSALSMGAMELASAAAQLDAELQDEVGKDLEVAVEEFCRQFEQVTARICRELED